MYGLDQNGGLNSGLGGGLRWRTSLSVFAIDAARGLFTLEQFDQLPPLVLVPVLRRIPHAAGFWDQVLVLSEQRALPAHVLVHLR